jgi:hypothetical protein
MIKLIEADFIQGLHMKKEASHHSFNFTFHDIDDLPFTK